MKLEIKTIKAILYKLEDITALGTKLPLVAFPQMKEHLGKLDEKQDEALCIPYKEVETLINEHNEDFLERDERALSRAFTRMNKKHQDWLEEYRQYYKKMEKRKKAIEILIGRPVDDT